MNLVKVTKDKHNGMNCHKLSISSALLQELPPEILQYIGNSVRYKLHLGRDSLIVFTEGDPIRERRMWVPKERLYDVQDRINWWIGQDNDDDSK